MSGVIPVRREMSELPGSVILARIISGEIGEIGEDISFLLCLILLRDLKGAPLASIGSHELSWVVSETLMAYGLLPPVSLISSKSTS